MALVDLLSEIFGKSHLLLAHLPIAFGAALALVRGNEIIDHERKHKLLKALSAALSLNLLFLVSTGLAQLRLAPSISALTIWHIVIGVLAMGASFAIFYLSRRKSLAGSHVAVMLGLMSVNVILGVFQSVGFHYILEPTIYDFQTSQQHGDQSQQHKVFYQTIRPILDRKCVRCHDSSIRSGDLILSNLDGLFSGGKNYKFIKDGIAEKSGFYLSISDSVFSKRHMPYLSGSLSKDEIKAVRSWIDSGGMGARSPASLGSVDQSVGQRHWAFRKFSKPRLPEVTKRNIFMNEVDAFILSEWEKDHEIEIQPLSREKLLRNLSLITTGLIPPRAMVQKAVENTLPDHAELVNYFVGNFHYGENLALHWMDASGFADDPGFDREEPVSTRRFREFLISSFNKDISYAEFLKSQLRIAGNNPKKSENLLLNFFPQSVVAYEAADKGMSFLFSLGLGVEISCARCHDHKSEPITNEEYYQVLKFFSRFYNIREPEDAVNRVKFSHPLTPGFLNVYETGEANGGVPERPADGSGFADWITDTQKGVGLYSARVYVNNVWTWVFGKGLIGEDQNFGMKTMEPKHINLLNWLTYYFLENNSSTKTLMKKILESQFFQSRFIESKAKLDLSGELRKKRRLPGEYVRDNFLASTDRLNTNIREVVDQQELMDSHEKFKHQRENRRSIYFTRQRQWMWTQTLANHFDIPSGQKTVVQRNKGSDFLEARFFNESPLFSGVVHLAAKDLFRKYKVFSEPLISEVYLNTLSRRPSPKEVDLWAEFFSGQADFFNGLRVMMSVIFAGDEFLNVD